MKKINLNSVKSFLSREEMRNTFGGDNHFRIAYIAGCFDSCNPNSNNCSGNCPNCIKSINEPGVGACGS